MIKPTLILGKKGKYGLALLVLLAVAALSVHFGPRYIYRFFGYLWLEKFESHLTENQINSIQKSLQGLKAKIVWSSSRTGNHEIFMMTLPDLNMYQITRNKYVDFLPRFSPDGEKIVFCRSQRPWVSQRDVNAWDVYFFSLKDNNEVLLARNANWPQWVANDKISFVRKNKLILKNLKSNQEETILDGNENAISSEIGELEFYPQDQNLLAFSSRGKMDGVFVMDRSNNSLLKIGQGCGITWVPFAREVIWMENGGNGGTQIFTSSISPVRQNLFMDLPGRYSHEYFPRLSRDGKWLVWAASAEGHEHDIADYEIFLWQVGTPFSQAIRLTYNAANDRWPDIFLEK